MKWRATLALIGSIGWGNAQAGEENALLLECRSLTGAEMLQNRPDCLQVLQQQMAVQTIQPVVVPAQDEPTLISRVLDAEWPQPMMAKRVSSYRQNYLMVTHSSAPNLAPTSPNSQNRVGPIDLGANELKFQISVKARISELAGGMLWFGYTQQSYWQLFDSGNSRPFRESNYEPELIYSYHLGEKTGLDWMPRIVNVGLVHQSNGQTLPYSRSWNRVYLQGGWEDDAFFGNTLVVMPRVWRRILDRDATQDDNPDITKYLGYGDVLVRYFVRRADGKDTVLGAVLRRRALQLDIAIPMSGSSDMSFHIQHFRGYGESLIDYNQKHFTTGIGFSAYF